MTVRDTKYTDPDSLRLLYVNPKNPLQNVDDQATLAAAEQLAITQPPSANISGGYNGPFNSGCPAIFQYVQVQSAPGNWGKVAKMVQYLDTTDYLWNPITNTFKRIARIRKLLTQRCVKYITFAGAESIVTLSHPVIQSFDDSLGRSISELIAEPEMEHSAVSVIGKKAIRSTIKTIEDAGFWTAFEISLADGGGIYTCGTDPFKTNVGHNKQVQDDGDGDEFPGLP